MGAGDIVAGTTLGGMVVDAKLGEGGMGAVFRAHDPRTGRSVAVKVIGHGATAEQAVRFRREGEAQARADAHPNVLRILSASESEGRAFLVMELASGGDLAERIKREGPLPIDEAVSVVLGVAAGVAHAHALGVLHRDLKPGNVLFDGPAPGGRPKVMDFGLAKVAGGQSLTRTGQLLGTPSYMAPEQIEDARAVDERADVYALGAVLFAALTGRAPFDAATVAATIYDVLQRPALSPRDLRPDVPPAIAAVVERALAKAPDDRYPTAIAFAAALEAARAAGGARSRRPAAIAAGVGLVVVGLVAVGLFAANAGAGAPPAPAPSSPGIAPPSTGVAAVDTATAPSRWPGLKPGEELRYEVEWREQSKDASSSRFHGALVLRLPSEGADGLASWDLDALGYAGTEPPAVRDDARGQTVLRFGVDAASGALDPRGGEGLRERLLAADAFKPLAGPDGEAMRSQLVQLVSAVFGPDLVTSLLRVLLQPGGAGWAWRASSVTRMTLAGADSPRLLPYTCSGAAGGRFRVDGTLTRSGGRPTQLTLTQTEPAAPGAAPSANRANVITVTLRLESR